MKFFLIVLAAAMLSSCFSPVSNPQTFTAIAATSSGLPLGTKESEYVGLGDGYGVWRYAKGGNGWTVVDWSQLYGSGKAPAVRALAVDGTRVYAATASGLVVGEGSGASVVLATSDFHDVYLDSAHSQILVAESGKLRYASWTPGSPSLPSLTSFATITVGAVAVQINKILVSGNVVYLATSSGILKSSSADLSGSPTWSSAGSSTATSTGLINTLATSSGLLLAGTTTGLSYLSGGTWTDVTASSTGGFRGAVNGVADNGSGVLLAATDAGLSGTTSSPPFTWNFLGSTGIPMLGIVASADGKSYFVADGQGGLGVVQYGTPLTNTTWSTALSGWNVTCVALGS